MYLVGLPGSGKSELARQYGDFVFKNGDVSTVITLNTESEERFKHDLIEPLLELKAAKGTELGYQRCVQQKYNRLPF